MRRSPRFFCQATGLHVAFDRGIRREPPESGLPLHQGGEIIEVELIALVWMVAVLENQPPGQWRGQGDLTAVFAQGAAQGAHGIIVPASGCVVPPLDGSRRELDVASAYGMGPYLVGEKLDRGLECSGRRGRTQERAHHRESKPRPSGTRRIGDCLDHHASTGWGERTATIRFHRSRSVNEVHLLRVAGDYCETLICRPPGTVIGERNRSRNIQPSDGG